MQLYNIVANKLNCSKYDYRLHRLTTRKIAFSYYKKVVAKLFILVAKYL